MTIIFDGWSDEMWSYYHEQEKLIIGDAEPVVRNRNEGGWVNFQVGDLVTHGLGDIQRITYVNSDDNSQMISFECVFSCMDSYKVGDLDHNLARRFSLVNGTVVDPYKIVNTQVSRDLVEACENLNNGLADVFGSERQLIENASRKILNDIGILIKKAVENQRQNAARSADAAVDPE